MTALNKIYHRVYQNYLMRDRLDEYSSLLAAFVGAGYRFCTMAEFADDLRSQRALATPLCLLRIDVDSDPSGAAKMFAIEEALGIRATYYFRLSTVDPALIERIVAYGSEVGYHFEEIATVAKRLGLTTPEQIAQHMPEIRAEFRQNFAWFRNVTRVAPATVASHGDFLNRRVGVYNNELLDRAMMDELRIQAETYEPWLMAAVTERVADRAAPQWWHPHHPFQALKNRAPVVNILVHPRQWVRNRALNAKLDVQRVAADLGYWWKRKRHASA